MKLLTSLAVAFAAGTISFAASAQPQPAMPKQYLFQPSANTDKAGDAKAENGNKKSVGKRTAKAKPETGKKRVTKAKAGKGAVQKTRKNRKRVTIDTTTTSSIAAYPVEQGSSEKSVGTGGPRFERFVAQHAVSNGVPVSLAHAVITIESNYRVNARGSAGEIGLMQIKPATARMMGYRGTTRGLYDPYTNIKYGMKYLGMAHKLGGGATCRTILKYNAGHAASRMNPVSSAYCGKVKRHLAG